MICWKSPGTASRFDTKFPDMVFKSLKQAGCFRNPILDPVAC